LLDLALIIEILEIRIDKKKVKEGKDIPNTSIPIHMLIKGMLIIHYYIHYLIKLLILFQTPIIKSQLVDPDQDSK